MRCKAIFLTVGIPRFSRKARTTRAVMQPISIFSNGKTRTKTRRSLTVENQYKQILICA